MRVPITYGQSDLKEAYPIFKGGTMIGDGLRYYFNLPKGAERFTLGYRGRSWPLRTRLFAPSGECVGLDTWIGSNDITAPVRRLSASAEKGREGWSFSVSGYGQAGLMEFSVQPKEAQRPLYFSLGRDKLFSPSQ